jgi:hypothetical protein
MKISLALGRTQAVSRETALACLTANLALPGSGSLAAGRRSGYLELLLAFVGVGLTLVFGVRFAIWMLTNWDALHSLDADPGKTLLEMWLAGRGTLLGFLVFLIAVGCSFLSSLRILKSARKPPPLAAELLTGQQDSRPRQ